MNLSCRETRKSTREKLSFITMYLPGAERFYRDIELMIGFRPCLYWKVLWSYVTPAVIMVRTLKVVSHGFPLYELLSYVLLCT